MIKTAELLGLIDAMEKQAKPFLASLFEIAGKAGKRGRTLTQTAKAYAGMYDKTMSQIHNIAGKLRAKGMGDREIWNKLEPMVRNRAEIIQNHYFNVIPDINRATRSHIFKVPVNKREHAVLSSFLGNDIDGATDRMLELGFVQPGKYLKNSEGIREMALKNIAKDPIAQAKQLRRNPELMKNLNDSLNTMDPMSRVRQLRSNPELMKNLNDSLNTMDPMSRVRQLRSNPELMKNLNDSLNTMRNNAAIAYNFSQPASKSMGKTIENLAHNVPKSAPRIEQTTSDAVRSLKKTAPEVTVPEVTVNSIPAGPPMRMPRDPGYLDLMGVTGGAWLLSNLFKSHKSEQPSGPTPGAPSGMMLR